MGMGHACCGLTPVIAVLILSTAFLIWVYEKKPSSISMFGRIIGWAAVVISALALISQIYMQGIWKIRGCRPMLDPNRIMMHDKMMPQEMQPPAQMEGKEKRR